MVVSKSLAGCDISIGALIINVDLILCRSIIGSAGKDAHTLINEALSFLMHILVALRLKNCYLVVFNMHLTILLILIVLIPPILWIPFCLYYLIFSFLILLLFPIIVICCCRL